MRKRLPIIILCVVVFLLARVSGINRQLAFGFAVGAAVLFQLIAVFRAKPPPPG